MNLLRVGKVEALKIYRYRNRYRGKSLFTYRLLTELKIPLPYISETKELGLALAKVQVMSISILILKTVDLPPKEPKGNRNYNRP